MTALSTRCVHVGELNDPHGSPHTPIYTSTTFKFANTQALLDVVEGRASAALYTRYGLNPTIMALEEKLATLENAEAAWAFCSGMAEASSQSQAASGVSVWLPTIWQMEMRCWQWFYLQHYYINLCYNIHTSTLCQLSVQTLRNQRNTTFSSRHP